MTDKLIISSPYSYPIFNFGTFLSLWTSACFDFSELSCYQPLHRLQKAMYTHFQLVPVTAIATEKQHPVRFAMMDPLGRVKAFGANGE